MAMTRKYTFAENTPKRGTLVLSLEDGLVKVEVTSQNGKDTAYLYLNEFEWQELCEIELFPWQMRKGMPPQPGAREDA